MAYPGYGRQRHDTIMLDQSQPHILKAPYQSVTIPRTETVNVEDLMNELSIDKDYTNEYFQPTFGEVNAGSLQFGHGGPTQNVWNQSNKKGKRKGFMGVQPSYQPEGGIQYAFEEAKMPEDYYAENKRRIQYVDIEPQIEHWEDPMIAFPSTGKFRLREKDLIPILPHSTFEVYTPEIKELAHKFVYKGSVSMSNIDAQYEKEMPNPIQVTKYIQNKNIKVVLPQVYDTYLKVVDKKIPIKLRDPNYIVMQAADSEAIDIPLPDGSILNLRDYQWTVVQGIDSSTELTIEIPVNLKLKPDVSHSLSLLSAEHEQNVEKSYGRIRENGLMLSHTAPVIDQITNAYISTPVPHINPSKQYYAVDNALEAFPTGLVPVKTEIKAKPRVYVQPEIPGTAPWLF